MVKGYSHEEQQLRNELIQQIENAMKDFGIEDERPKLSVVK